MPGGEVLQDLQSDATNHAGAIELIDISSSTPRAGATWETEKKIVRPTATRTALSTADATADQSGNYTSALAVGNSRYVAVYVNFHGSSQSAGICLALWDASDNFLGFTETYTFNGSATYTDGTNYVSARYIFDVSGAAKCWPVLVSLSSSGEVHNIYMMPL